MKTDNRFLKMESYPVEVINDEDNFVEEDYARLDEALANLNHEQREIIVLSRYQGLKYEEISVIVNQSVPAIKVAMHRAIKQLRGIYFKQI
jgi:RNA polymerase sigma-70 factor (ECF subfamily)